MSEEHVSCIEASDSPCTPETCEETICWVCEEPDPSWPCPSRRAQDAEAAIARVRELCSQSRAVVHVGCRCSTDECSGTCGAGKPLAWDLDPADVLLAMKGDSDE